MVTADAARNVVGIIGVEYKSKIGNIHDLAWEKEWNHGFGPPTFYRIIKKKTVEEFKPDPYIATVLNCLFWCLYGMPFVHPDSLLVVTINGVGLVLELAYLAVFFIYAQSKGRKKVAFGLGFDVVFFVAIAAISLTALHGTKKRSLMVGIVCDIFNIIMYGSPLTIMVSNGLGAVSGAIQLILYAAYFKSTPKDDEDLAGKPTTEVQLSNTNAAAAARV
ncbi:bidirectional sugar transporter SWEET6a-like [Prunus yedoensis var. nudiflora]|uniref:Bidirectional sugar transporter SWEET6a-like n=1 Tax=Prunus yedoensis var. nudiflora TaxID=2094558 RepID=A0A314ZCD4_PRUYE|nr:bidirectional sugar transporter SWEET6a-like [Prunus yedoensis var. nudiflora]